MHGLLVIARSKGAASAVFAVCGLLLVMPYAAKAAGNPATTVPEVTGTAQEGFALSATATWSGDPEPTTTWEWLRCAKEGGACTAVAGATSSSHELTAYDVGWFLRARVTVTNSVGSVKKRSEPTAQVRPAGVGTPEPTVTPDPTATPSPSPSPSPSPGPSSTPVLSLAPVPVSIFAPVLVVPVASPSLLVPFPVVRITGLILSSGVRITRFSVDGPAGARVAVSCSGHSCPVARLVASVPVAHLRRFERALRRGTRLRVVVTQPGRMGKWTEILIRSNQSPKRTDRCIAPGKTKPERCPAA
jgi:hypothetical protein